MIKPDTFFFRAEHGRGLSVAVPGGRWYDVKEEAGGTARVQDDY